MELVDRMAGRIVTTHIFYHIYSIWENRNIKVSAIYGQSPSWTDRWTAIQPATYHYTDSHFSCESKNIQWQLCPSQQQQRCQTGSFTCHSTPCLIQTSAAAGRKNFHLWNQKPCNHKTDQEKRKPGLLKRASRWNRSPRQHDNWIFYVQIIQFWTK